MSMTNEEKVSLALRALTAIEKIIQVVRGAHAGKVDAKTALASIDALHRTLNANDLQADQALEQKFAQQDPIGSHDD